VKKQILFVDDEANLLQGLQRMLRPMRQEWDMHFADDGPTALALLDETPCDVVVSDMRMPGMDGAALLAEVRQRHPVAVRLILSGHSDRDMILRAIGPTHQFLTKPCDPEILKNTVSRACMLRDLLPDTALTQMVTGIETLPSVPAVYQQVVEAAQTPESSLDTIGQMITSDLGMTAKTLQLVQSAFFGLQRHLCNPTQAVDLLGLDTIQALVLTAHVFSYIDAATMGGLSLETLWDHSMAVGTCARHVMQSEISDPAVLDETFTAGLLHDVGSLILITHLPDAYTQAQTEAAATAKPIWEVERSVLGATHAQVGAYLMGLWGLSDAIIEALAYHHDPAASPSQTLCPLSAVHIANVLVHEVEPRPTTPYPHSLDRDYLEQLGLFDRLPVWREQCRAALLERNVQRRAEGADSHA
jgi:HD-like signal output (HDOD) protein